MSGMPARLGDLAKLIRSKNAGPFWITFDIMFATDSDFERVVQADVLTRDWIAKVWQRDVKDIVLVALPQARAIKFSFPRRPVQGDPGEMDQYAGQQYAPLIDLEIT
ncbi:MAG: DUF4387 domain-containing protein [Geminicoccaceae bacterium]